MFGKKQTTKEETDPISYDGVNIISMNFWNDSSKKYPMIDDLIGKGYELLTMSGMDGYLVTMRKPRT